MLPKKNMVPYSTFLCPIKYFSTAEASSSVAYSYLNENVRMITPLRIFRGRIMIRTLEAWNRALWDEGKTFKWYCISFPRSDMFLFWFLCFVLFYLKTTNTIWKIKYASYSKLSKNIQIWHQTLGGKSGSWIIWKFWSITLKLIPPTKISFFSTNLL